MYMPNASWRRRGVATASRGVSPPLQRERSGSGKGVAQRRSAQAKRGRLGRRLAGARGGLPLAFLYLRRGVAGRDDLPAEVGGAGPKGRRQGGNLIPVQQDIAVKPDQSVYLCFDRRSDSNVDCGQADTDIVDIELPSDDLAPTNRSACRCRDFYRA